ncbi:SAM-dependent methyltransferase [Streptacidiphilus neutrinimicus]|uniref:SAM-dependent methyltransferase n=1 Tax=Streptacidiphilus neutrinimicus TaxID=105420 RepID=UPI000AB2E342|nr:SAM-dependent methyltransferase [Streptacidiphilus neutrinimicus]
MAENTDVNAEVGAKAAAEAAVHGEPDVAVVTDAAIDWDWAVAEEGDAEPRTELRTDVPHPARMYDYYLGGKDNFPADRVAAEQVVGLIPTVQDAARANRRFLGRAVRYASSLGIRQFLDIGTGIPTAENTHEVAQRQAPESRIVYVDNDPMVLTHARALLSSTPQGRTAYVDADFHDADAILDAAAVKEMIDFEQPVALLVVALLHFLPDSDEPFALLDRYKQALAPGSVLILTHGSSDYSTQEIKDAVERIYKAGGITVATRPRDEIERFGATGEDGWELVGPGVVSINEWQAGSERVGDEDLRLSRSDVGGYGLVAIKKA